jgi:hypothetical protein
MAAALPGLDIFSRRFVERYPFGWRLTQQGLRALEIMERYARNRDSTEAGRSRPPSPNATRSSGLMDSAAWQARSRFTISFGGKTVVSGSFGLSEFWAASDRQSKAVASTSAVATVKLPTSMAP